jgi:apolipoprotein N-acyltransferase
VSTAAPGMRAPWPWWPRVLGAAASGLLATLAFPPYDVWPLALPAIAWLALLCRGQRPWRAAVLGLVHGTATFLPLLTWMQVIGVDAWIALALLEAAFISAMAALFPAVLRLPFWPLWTACLWVAEELGRATIPFGGFPWGRVAFGQTGSPFTPYASWGGAPLVSFATAFSGGLLALALLRWRRRAVAVGALLSAVAVPLLGLAIQLPTSGPTITVAIVQGGVAEAGLGFLGEREQVLRNHVRATEKLAADIAAGRVPRPDIVIWPENASDIDPFSDPEADNLIQGAVDAVGVPVLVGAVLDGPGPDYVSNTGIVWSPSTGPGERYVKRHPVPFGEYIPFRDQLSGLTSRLDQIPRDFVAGSRPGVLDLGPARVGDVICFEIAYDGVVRDVVDGGARVLVVQTNNATYNGTGQPAQQLAMSRLRAVEHGRAVLVAATSGISALVMPDGDVQARTRELTTETLVADVPLRTARTVASKLGAVPEWALAALGLVAAAVATVLARRERNRQ